MQFLEKNQEKIRFLVAPVDGDGNRIYISYDKYLQQKADVPLYLATANTNQTGNLQAELSDRNNNVTQKIKKSSADLINFYEGA